MRQAPDNPGASAFADGAALAPVRRQTPPPPAFYFRRRRITHNPSLRGSRSTSTCDSSVSRCVQLIRSATIRPTSDCAHPNGRVLPARSALVVRHDFLASRRLAPVAGGRDRRNRPSILRHSNLIYRDVQIQSGVLIIVIRTPDSGSQSRIGASPGAPATCPGCGGSWIDGIGPLGTIGRDNCDSSFRLGPGITPSRRSAADTCLSAPWLRL